MNNNKSMNKDAVEIIGCYKGKLSTILFKKKVKGDFDRDIPLITIFKKRDQVKRKKANTKIFIEYDEFYQEIHIKAETKKGTEYITKYLDEMNIINEKRYFIRRGGGGGE